MQYQNYAHRHVSEREAAHRFPDGTMDNARWEDCLWASAVEALRFGGLGIEATLAVAETIRHAAGEPPDGPSNQGDLRRGVRKHYGIKLSQGSGFKRLWARLKPGTAAVVDGSLGAFPKGHPLRKYLPDYNGGHAIAVFRLDDSDRVWWCDPLGPAGIDGRWVDKADLAAYVRAFGGSFTTISYDEYRGHGNGSHGPVATLTRVAVAGMIEVRFVGTRVGVMKTTRKAAAFDLETRQPRPIPEAYERNVVMEVLLAETLSKSLRAGELMLMTTWGDPDRLELIRAADTDWPRRVRAPENAPPPSDQDDMIRVNFAGTRVGLATTTRATKAIDLETRDARDVAAGFERNVVMVVQLAEPVGDLPEGELMLMTTWGDPDRFELIRAADTDWSA